MFTRWLRLAGAVMVGVLAGVVLPATGASAAEGGQLEMHASTYLTETHAGGEFFFQSGVRNTGDTTLHDVTLTHTLPAGVVLRHAEGSYTDGDNVDHVEEGQVLTFLFPVLEPGESAIGGVASVTASVPDVFAVGDVLIGRVTAFSPDSALPTTIGGDVCADDPTSACLPVEIVDGPRLSLALEADAASARPGDTVRFSVEVRNTGVVDATAFLVGSLPPALEFEASEVLTPSEYTDPGEGASFYDPITVAAGETLSFGVVSTLGEAPLGSVLTFALDLYSSGIVDSDTPCTDGTDSWYDTDSSGCAAIAVARAGIIAPPVSPPAARPAVRPGGAAVPADAAVPTAAAADAGVAVQAPAAVTTAARVLASTGTDTAVPAVSALAALALGALLLASGALSRRRRPAAPARAADAQR